MPGGMTRPRVTESGVLLEEAPLPIYPKDVPPSGPREYGFGQAMTVTRDFSDSRASKPAPRT